MFGDCLGGRFTDEMEGVLVGGKGGGDFGDFVFSSSVAEVAEGARRAETEEEVLAVDKLRVRPDRRGGGGGGLVLMGELHCGCGFRSTRFSSDIRIDRAGGPKKDFGRS